MGPWSAFPITVNGKYILWCIDQHHDTQRLRIKREEANGCKVIHNLSIMNIYIYIYIAYQIYKLTNF